MKKEAAGVHSGQIAHFETSLAASLKTALILALSLGIGSSTATASRTFLIASVAARRASPSPSGKLSIYSFTSRQYISTSSAKSFMVLRRPHACHSTSMEAVDTLISFCFMFSTLFWLIYTGVGRLSPSIGRILGDST